jgi:hypothetical protein
MDPSTTPSWISAFVFAYIIGPISLAWGWIRWTIRPKLWSVPAIVSMTAFVIASISAAIGLGTIGYAFLGGFERHYDSFYRVIALGGATSLAGILLALCGIWRKSPLRWFALTGAAGTLAFWIVATTWP